MTERGPVSWRTASNAVHRWPLRARIIAVLAALLGCAMFLVGMAGSWRLQGYLVQREDADLRAAAPTLVTSTLQQVKAGHEARIPSVVPTNIYAVAVVENNTVREYHPATRQPPQFEDITKATVQAHHGQPYTVGSIGDSDERWRVVQGIDTATGQPYAVAVSLRNVQGVIQQMQVLTIGVSTLALLACVAVALVGVRRALRPLRDIEDTAAAIAAGDFGRRVPDPQTADEVESLAASFNAMLGQIEASMEVKDRSEESMRRFVADASHELRTPLATVRGYAELYRQGAVTDPEAVAAGFRRIEDEAKRMSDMVEHLLLLSRLETEQRANTIGAPSTRMPRHEVDLLVLAMDTVADAEARQARSDTPRTFRVTALDGALHPLPVRGDEQRLRQVIANLVANAERYSPPGTSIEIGVGVRDGRPSLSVIDHGPGVPAELRERVFERFYRADVVRTRTEGSTGLGLSIVAAIVAAHDGTIAITDTPGGGATFTISLAHYSADGSPPNN